jgi:hypothetical protein
MCCTVRFHHVLAMVSVGLWGAQLGAPAIAGTRLRTHSAVRPA